MFDDTNLTFFSYAKLNVQIFFLLIKILNCLRGCIEFLMIIQFEKNTPIISAHQSK